MEGFGRRWRTTAALELRQAPAATSTLLRTWPAGTSFEQAAGVLEIDGVFRISVFPRGWVNLDRCEPEDDGPSPAMQRLETPMAPSLLLNTTAQAGDARSATADDRGGDGWSSWSGGWSSNGAAKREESGSGEEWCWKAAAKDAWSGDDWRGKKGADAEGQRKSWSSNGWAAKAERTEVAKPHETNDRQDQTSGSKDPHGGSGTNGRDAKAAASNGWMQPKSWDKWPIRGLWDGKPSSMPPHSEAMVDNLDGKPSDVPRHAEVVVENLVKCFPEYQREGIVAELVRADFHVGSAEQGLSGAALPAAHPEHAAPIVDALAERLPQYQRGDSVAELSRTDFHGGSAERRLIGTALPAAHPEHAAAIVDTLAERFPQYNHSDIAAELVNTNNHGGQAISKLDKNSRNLDGKPSGGPPDGAETVVDNLEKSFPEYQREDIVAELARADFHGGSAEQGLSGAALPAAHPEHVAPIVDTLAERLPQYQREDSVAELVRADFHGGSAKRRLSGAALPAAHPRRPSLIAELVGSKYHSLADVVQRNALF